ncbi:MAG: ATP-binding protein [Dehalococcoidales bacterium]
MPQPCSACPTTRGGRGGTGLGLSVCHSIITEHDGRIYVKSQPGMGATFSVELPLTAKRMGKGQAAQTFLP